MKITTFTVGPLQENCYLVVDEVEGRAVLVDPGDEAERLAKAVRASGATLEAIWLTHAHVDHVGAVGPLAKTFGVPVALHPLDAPIYALAEQMGAQFGMRIGPLPAPTVSLADGDELTLGSLTFSVQHLPGHAPGHVAFIGQGVALAGDLLFAGSIGRTDLPMSDPRAMRRSLQRLAALPPDVVVYPGHGPATTIGRELASNPFLSGLARPIGS